MWIADKVAYRNVDTYTKAYKGTELLWEKVTTNYLKFTANTAGSTVGMTQVGSPTAITLETSTDGTTWNSYTVGNTITLTNAGDYVYFRGNNSTISVDDSNFNKFVMTGSIAASGSVMSLLDNTCTSTTISHNYCFYALFHQCSSLTVAPALPATTLAEHCYISMFYECTGLNAAPALPATTLTKRCYGWMFYGCTGLTSAPELPATTLAQNCYNYMFYGCTGLTSAPELPATTLATSCYLAMFYGCTGLTSAPELPATTLTTSCYNSMFYGCSNLNYINAAFLTKPGTDYTNNWVSGVAATGTFVKNVDANWYIIGANGVPVGWVANDNFIKFTANTAGSTISLKEHTQQSSTSYSFLYSRNGTNWYNYTYETTLTLTNAGDFVMFRGEHSRTAASDSHYCQFSMTGSIAASGSVMSLIQGIENSKTLIYDNCFNYLFKNCDVMTTAPSLPATTLTEYCYTGMFYGCNALTSAPALPATTLPQCCYDIMFACCTSLTSAPSINATTVGWNSCCQMFAHCYRLTTAPELPATTLTEYCYTGMFYGCTSLVNPPSTLPATTLADSCYGSMFRGCTALKTAPTLPATTLASGCYNYMFYGCTALKTAPTLPATTLVRTGCYSNMFNGCTRLNYIKALFTTTPGSYYTEDWVSGVASTGTFVKSSSATWSVTGVNGVPSGWTVITE